MWKITSRSILYNFSDQYCYHYFTKGYESIREKKSEIICNVWRAFNPFSTRPHQNVVWYNKSWLGFLKKSELCTKTKRKKFCKNEPSFVTVKMLRWLIGINLGEIICKSSNLQHIQRLKITTLGANWQLFRLERIAKCSYFILSTQNIKFYWFVINIKKNLLPIWWYNKGSFPLGNKYFGVFILNGLMH